MDILATSIIPNTGNVTYAEKKEDICQIVHIPYSKMVETHYLDRANGTYVFQVKNLRDRNICKELISSFSLGLEINWTNKIVTSVNFDIKRNIKYLRLNNKKYKKIKRLDFKTQTNITATIVCLDMSINSEHISYYYAIGISIDGIREHLYLGQLKH